MSRYLADLFCRIFGHKLSAIVKEGYLNVGTCTRRGSHQGQIFKMDWKLPAHLQSNWIHPKKYGYEFKDGKFQKCE